MDIRAHLEKMDSGALHAFHVMLANTGRTREVPGLTIDTRVCHDLCGEACLIIAFGATLGHVFSLSAFVEKLIAWCSRLAVVAAEEAEAAQKPKKKQRRRRNLWLKDLVRMEDLTRSLRSSCKHMNKSKNGTTMGNVYS